jgi:chromosome segregation ATPase
VSEEKSLSVEWRHRAERAEQDAGVAMKEKEKAKEEVKQVKESIANLERNANESIAEIAATKASLETEQSNHIRTQRGIVDQQKLISQHLSKNQTLNAQIEEQKEAMTRMQIRLTELEVASSSAVSTLSYQV